MASLGLFKTNENFRPKKSDKKCMREGIQHTKKGLNHTKQDFNGLRLGFVDWLKIL